jgi:hypothetical protein
MWGRLGNTADAWAWMCLNSSWPEKIGWLVWKMGVIRPKGRRLAYSAAGSGQTKVVLSKSHFEISESIPYSNLNAFAVSQMSCLSCHLFLPDVAYRHSSHTDSINAPRTAPFCSYSQHNCRLRSDCCSSLSLPLCSLLVEHTMSALLAPDRVTPSQTHFVIALATDILHLWTCRAVPSLNAV